MPKFCLDPSFVLSLLLCGASLPAYCLEVPTAPVNEPISVEGKNINAKIQFAKFHSALEMGEETEELEQGLFCLSDKKLRYTATTGKVIEQNLAVFFPRALKKAGYARFGGNDSTFESDPLQAADFQLGATLLDFKSRECAYRDQRKGAYYLKVKWELFSARLQKVVYTKVIEGGSNVDSFTAKFDFLESVYTHLINNLLADPEFVAVVANADQPAPAQAAADAVQTAALDQALLSIIGGRAPAGGMQKNASTLRSAVATVINNNVMGSAFYISRDGYLLTDLHVVANARYVKIRLLNKHELTGEVLRANAARDIALIKTSPVDFDPIAIRFTEANVGEEVYAIGSPISEALAGTVTRGVLSGVRRFDGRDYLQSDVSINHGNSGGPLLDADGNAVGLTEMFYNASIKSGLNLFTPIGDALKKLNVEILN